METTNSSFEIPQGREPHTPNPYIIPASIVIAGALIAGAVVYTNLRNTIPSKTPQVAAVGGIANPKNLEDDDPVLGSPKAPVTLVEFGDFQCPFCGRYFTATLPHIREKYIKTGKVKLIYRDFPLSAIHEVAQKAAEASECADEQGKFWQYHDMLYTRQAELSPANLKTWASEIGLDMTRFNQCLDSGKYAAEVQKDYEDGQAAGVQGTPATFVNGRLVSGAVPLAQFEAIIEEELKK